MSVTSAPYGKLPDGTEIDLYTLTNPHGLTVKIMTYGATITDVEVPDRDGKLANVTLYRDSLDGYLDKDVPRLTSAPPSAATPTASPRASSPSTARNIRWPSTTAPTTCTAA